MNKIKDNKYYINKITRDIEFIVENMKTINYSSFCDSQL